MKALLKKELKSFFYSKRAGGLGIAFVLIALAFFLIFHWDAYFLSNNKNYSDTKANTEEGCPKDVAFIEGHGEVDQVYLLDAEKVLAEHYNVHRGEIGNRVGALDGFSVVIIVGPKEKFLEEEKYVLDQYIMQGGKVLWLIDGVYISEEDMKMQGWSASIKNDINLDNMLTSYGVRVKPQFIQHKVCNDIQLVSNETGRLVPRPNPYSPKITVDPNSGSFISTSVHSLYLNFISPVEFVESNVEIKSTVLLKSLDESSLVYVPAPIYLSGKHDDLGDEIAQKQEGIPFAISLEGEFLSHFINRKRPVSIESEVGARGRGKSKMVIIGTSSIFRNELKGQGENTEILPMGYDRTTEYKHSNAQFLRNVMSWLSEDSDQK